MAYGDFTLDLLEERFGLSILERPGLFSGVPPVEPGPILRANLERNLPLVEGVGTEKARSEMLIAPVLVEVREQVGRRIAVFSGAEFNVDPADGLVGYCDFLLSRSPSLLRIAAPVAVIVEAKREDLTAGLPQCLAEMVAAQRFNARREEAVPVIYGAVTSGTAWRFLRLAGATAEVDLYDWYIVDVDRVLGVLVHMVEGAPA